MEIKQNPDFYNDFYNLLTEEEKDNFYTYADVEDMENLKPDEVYETAFTNTDEVSTLQELIYDFLISGRIQEALQNLVLKGKIDGFSIDDEKDIQNNKFICTYNAHVGLDEGGLINSENYSDSYEMINAVTVRDYEDIILKTLIADANA